MPVPSPVPTPADPSLALNQKGSSAGASSELFLMKFLKGEKPLLFSPDVNPPRCGLVANVSISEIQSAGCLPGHRAVPEAAVNPNGNKQTHPHPSTRGAEESPAEQEQPSGRPATSPRTRGLRGVRVSVRLGGPALEQLRGWGSRQHGAHSQDPGLGWGQAGGIRAAAASSAEPGGTLLPVLTAGTRLGGGSLGVRSLLEEAGPECSVRTSPTGAQDPGRGSEPPPRAPVTPIAPA